MGGSTFQEAWKYSSLTKKHSFPNLTFENHSQMKIKNILIANRGEIAVRIMKTARKMGIRSTVIKTAAEPSAMYLSLADNVFDDTESVSEIPVFLDIDRLIHIANETGADAIHPGYGFLAENPYFAQKCLDNKIIFIGPSPDSIYKMGNKTIARKIALANNIPMASGSKGQIPTEKDAIIVARNIGYPVIIKASSGGGGRGMRIVRKEEDMPKMFRLASNEADKAFSDPSVFIEKYIENPKHIEFQILGDKFGNIIHLGERECSVQRKHQKLLEEAPSSALDSKLRDEMGKIAIKISSAVGYYSAGTVEFLLDSEGSFYFMEMNTRIQVEHPVTELITGTDLIEQQILIAEEKKLKLEQEDIKLEGWAIECRINAEDVQSGFSPAPGKIEQIIMPEGDNIRVDSGVKAGSVIAANFDSMIAKLIVKGNDRKEALKNCKHALDKVWIKGTKTTLPFFRMLIRNERFLNGTITTSFIENELDNYHVNSEYEELLAAWMATWLFVDENLDESNLKIDAEEAKNLSPWLLNKRISRH